MFLIDKRDKKTAARRKEEKNNYWCEE